MNPTNIASAILRTFFVELKKIGHYPNYTPYIKPVELQPDKAFTTDNVDKKIEKMTSHIDHVKQSISHRNTHGGKAFRSRNISIKEQVSSASERLELLQTARADILDKRSKVAHEVKKAHAFMLGFVEGCWREPYRSKLTAMLYNAGIKTSPIQQLAQQLTCPVNKSKVRKTVRFESS